MTYRGKVKGGVIVLDTPASLPEGTEVAVQPLAPSAQPKPGNVGQRLMRFAGQAKGLPPDAARNHDHYLYGTRKR